MDMGASARAGWIWSWGLLSLSTALCLGSPLVPKGANVILFSGLPGDIESETVYRDQLQALLKVVQARAAANVFVLCDDPKAVETPPNAHLKVLKGDRSSFLSLTNNLGTSTNSLVVMLWGHGGTQGNKPVFHVRGPRLTPADLLELASQHAPSRIQLGAFIPWQRCVWAGACRRRAHGHFL